MKVSIIMATYNRNELLIQTLQGLMDMDTTGLYWEIIVVDNAGNAETSSVCKSFAASIPLKFLVEKAPGKNNALNSALSHAAGELIIFTDDDVIPDRDWVKSLIEAAGHWKTADLFGGRILPKFPDGMIAPKIDIPNFIETTYVIADRDIEEGEFPAGDIWGPNMMVRRHLFDQGLRFNTDIGPTGNSYVMGSETEFLHRVGNAGHIAVYVPSALVYHQIRPEQLTHSWLFGRAFRLGRGRAYLDRSKPVLEFKKWMLRDIGVLYARYIFSCLFGSKSERLEDGIKFHIMRGHLYQSYKGRN